ncbi:sensor histidine kinase [Acrocarpospora phusangensis]|uniref:sensor histidine kinase n=1 Tax=Acrocarpospora phusangensis TaxID=1070424 RepID=UPI001950552D|nr:HAMP domain-containing sensor histidine kinase [Acrocarpospora phusangensis]
MAAILPSSIRVRTTVGVALLALVCLTVIGVTLDFLVLDRARTQAFHDTQRAATEWIGSFEPGKTPTATPLTSVDLLQLVDSRGRVVAASKAAEGLPPLSTLKPPPSDRIENGTVCSPQHGCLVFTASRLLPQTNRMFWHNETHFVYAAMREPNILSTPALPIATVAGVLLLTGLVAWGNFRFASRMMSRVEAISTRMSEITVSDLSLRVPQPPGRDEHAVLACTVNRTLARLEQSVELQRRFASTTSHEIRTPLAGLRARLEEAVLYPDDVDPRETVSEALAVTDRLVAIVDDLLVLSRLRAGAPAVHEPVDLGALIVEETATLPAGVPVHVYADPEVRVEGNRIQLIRVLSNLLANARRHADGGVEVTAERADGHAVITVTDDGDGIAPKDRERVFERFVRLDAARTREPGGTGLGLAISRDIAQAHRGTLLIEDAPRGAKFVLRLPLLDTAERPAA